MPSVKQFREVLIFVAGATPQIVTETIYALAMQNPSIHADELHIITHCQGKQLIMQKLGKDGVLQQLCKEYGIPQLPLSDANFLVITDQDGNELSDIRTVADNEQAGDQIAAFLRTKAAEPLVRLHCSLSGGRKTMTHYMGIAFQLFARQWDRLYHVMVAPEFEKVEQFFYPPKQPQQLNVKNRTGEVIINTADANVSLVQLPMIYLRDKVPSQATTIREIVAEGQKEIDMAATQRPVRINLAERTLYIGDTLIDLSPIQLMLYTTFLNLKRQPCRFSSRDYCHECTACFIPLVDLTSSEAIEQMARDYQAIYGNDPLKADELLEKWDRNLQTDLLRQQISKINAAIRDDLNDPTLLPIYKVSTVKQYGSSRYGVRVEKGKISCVRIELYNE